MGKSSGSIKVTVGTKKQAVKPKFSSGNAGLLTARIVATVNKNKK